MFQVINYSTSVVKNLSSKGPSKGIVIEQGFEGVRGISSWLENNMCKPLDN